MEGIKKKISKKFEIMEDDLEYIISPLQYNLIDLLQKNGPMSRSELVESVDKPRTTVYDNLMRLAKYDLIKKFPRPRNDVGRPIIYFKLCE